ncbi:MAG: hypothetical protein M3Z83_06155 [Actinomycetota bacterium]|nr:hypothetical protein [Actinomycetota bacterium]
MGEDDDVERSLLVGDEHDPGGRDQHEHRAVIRRARPELDRPPPPFGVGRRSRGERLPVPSM